MIPLLRSPFGSGGGRHRSDRACGRRRRRRVSRNGAIMLKNRSHLHLTDADAVGERASVLAAMSPHYRAIGREAYAERAREMSRSR